MLKIMVYSILLVGLHLNIIAKDATGDLLALLNKYSSSNSIEIIGTSTSYVATSVTPVMDASFKIIKSNGNIFYEDKYHTFLVKPGYDVWVDHVNQSIYISYKSAKANKSNKYINPAASFEFIKTNIKSCTVNDISTGKEYDVQYNTSVTYCQKSLIKIDDNQQLKEIEYFFNNTYYLSKTIVKYASISTVNTIDAKSFDETKYAVKSGTKWTTAKGFKNYNIQIFEYEELF